MCKCGRPTSLHDANVARDDTSDQWTPDAYGEIDFLGQRSQTKTSPVSYFIITRLHKLLNINHQVPHNPYGTLVQQIKLKTLI